MEDIHKDILSYAEYKQQQQFEQNMWKKTAATGIELPFTNLESKQQYILGSDCVHGLIAGGSNLSREHTLDVLLLNLMYMYSPKEISIILLDCKNTYAKQYNDYILPVHISQVYSVCKNEALAIESMQNIINTARDRYQFLAQEHKLSFDDYCKHNKENKNFCRVLVVINEVDEFLHSANTRVADEAKKLIQVLEHIGRFVGMHAILFGKTFEQNLLDMCMIHGALKCNRNVSIQTLGSPIASQLEEDERYLILAKNVAIENIKYSKYSLPFINSIEVKKSIQEINERSAKEEITKHNNTIIVE